MGFVVHSDYDDRRAEIAGGVLRLYEPEQHDGLLAFIGIGLPFDPVSYVDDWTCKQCGNSRQFRVGWNRKRQGGANSPLPLEDNGDHVCGAETDLRVIKVPEKRVSTWNRHKPGEPLTEAVLGPLDDPIRHAYSENYLKYGHYKGVAVEEVPRHAWEGRQVVPKVVKTRKGTCPTVTMDGWKWPNLEEAWRQHTWLRFASQWNTYVSTQGRSQESVYMDGYELPMEWMPPGPELAAIQMHIRMGRLEDRLSQVHSEIMNKLAGSHIVYP